MISLREFIFSNNVNKYISKEDLYSLFIIIELTSKIIHNYIILNNITRIKQEKIKKNIHGEHQTKLDLLSNKKFIDMIKTHYNIAGIASEEEAKFISFKQEKYGKYIFLIDPLDGSLSADCNTPVGTIFSLYCRVTPIGVEISEKDFLQPGNKQILSGYILYGSSTILVFTVKSGVHIFTYHPFFSTFFLSKKNFNYPKKNNIYSINEANYNNFSLGIKKYIMSCKSNNNISSRYTGSLVADFHRNLIKGGIYLYPNTKIYKHGKLRLMYECNPIALISSQANGSSSDGNINILDINPKILHQCSPFFVGTKSMVKLVNKFILGYYNHN
ncbi:fbp [Wigglesworthia glossinidia endosymbiont of Glossina brevipalpis]|uniref:Fructose-1,6-bisphosphatase class 1 n=1 Tax=Wigglesworthia glossinidia brevipalpis TaxID=36870 RepID=F16PA_WIGBR|nr:RecName: Full=Fructose-1,6-bisphosphatase class 1; Short=FBPase class 1; AltName: Full=D-fructose-1,6-bisphosphate 1-phosphohydrolase class 1 [Wigglesworthia glossinidia endosymbiont of Glossina brevipalpis]BAC24625.1 fbp [Wigglesworthia glossinidia endosymbiont of Glossina brevipalpis]